MVGIVVVSHSAQLAAGVAELAEQMTQGKCPIAVAGGIDDPANPIGTDPVSVMTAIETVADDSGVLILMDLGSALMSAEMAIELIDPELAEKVQMCAAPLVEGTMAAAVAAASGLPLEAVKQEAMGALAAKQKHLGVEDTSSPAEDAGAHLDGPALTFNWKVLNHNGLHARPAAAIVGALAGFDATVQLECRGEKANAKSLNAVAVLAVRRDEDVILHVSGPDAQAAIDAFARLAKEGFGEDVDAAPEVHVEAEIEAPVEAIDGAIVGLPASDGIAFGPASFFTVKMPEVPTRASEGTDAELKHLTNAIDAVFEGLQAEAAHAKAAKDTAKAEIFTAHAGMLSDPELLPRLTAEIEAGAIAEAAWMSVMGTLKAQYEASDSAYMRERGADVLDITRQVMIALCGSEADQPTIEPNTILFAEDLTPSDTARLDKNTVLGICLAGGGKTSHSAIIARAMGIPAIVRATGCLTEIKPGQDVILDGFSGRLWTNAPADEREALASRRDEWRAALEQTKTAALEPAVTKDGVRYPILANIGSFADVAGALENGAEGVGLLRTEFLFQSRAELPDEEFQYEEYKRIAAAFGENPITIRTLDVGGDKPLASYPMAEEENPFLGHRGVRMCLSDPALFKTQIRALIRAAAEQPNIQMMVPMIANVRELKAVKALVEECRAELGMPAETVPMQVGIMIEVPSAVLDADALALEADFFSIGTNDLTQYVMAADRGNPQVAELVDYNEPAVLKAIQMTCEAGKRAGIAVSMCGEMAGDTKVTELLLRLGISKLSASGSLLPALKAKVRQSSLA
ncbi:phosphoenolpyruvate--protein phosphotransferase [Rhodobacteraceae bacterium RKSG542]|uniref:phosphoenolpyruvate--protein phosphotransferase n=1 Tax=Pseudovibrio flavus TaxID=2529854 RepID=UPI0012BC8293|nr:phosphoenolpyruvate--protein phosphotransferase [Pseudovibrio flavus]MTI16503.1 phosphoenolpyruvate--protein phosphotransferase [Pseudovibrio flavus]